MVSQFGGELNHWLRKLPNNDSSLGIYVTIRLAISKSSRDIQAPASRIVGLRSRRRRSGSEFTGVVDACQSSGRITPTHKKIGLDQHIVLDLNHDGTPDLTIREIGDGNSFFTHQLQAVPQRGGGIKITDTQVFAAAMTAGSAIGPFDPFISAAAIMAESASYGIYYSGSWTPPTTKRYLGIRFLINGEIHYGWARLTTKITSNGTITEIEALVTGYAYETQPNKPIRAGDMGNSKADSAQVNETSPVESKPSVTLGALALGVRAIPIWRSTAQ